MEAENNGEKMRKRCDDGSGGDDSKKPREGCSGSYTKEADVFEERDESADCQMNNLYILANSNKVMKIKDNKQLIDLSFNVEFLTTKFDELEKDRKKKQ